MAPRSPALLSGSLVLLLLATAAWVGPLSFIGPARPVPRGEGALSQRRGYRFDWMLEQKDGTNTLQTQDGYWVGEVGFEKSQAAQGFRYRLRPTAEEYKNNIEVDGLLVQLGPIKLKLGEMFGGTSNNPAKRELKRKIAKKGLSDPAKIAENEYWMNRYGHARWVAPYVEQSTGLSKGFLRGLAAWSGFDPLEEERGKTWIEADYGKPWLAKYIGVRQPGLISAEQVKKEYDTGKLLKK